MRHKKERKFRMFTPDGHGVQIYKKGKKHRVFVDMVTGKIIITNPSPFKSSFFSRQGQAERIRNVGRVLRIAANPARSERLTANVGSRSARRVIEAVANNPYTSAAIAAGGITAGRAALTKTPQLAQKAAQLTTRARAAAPRAAKAAEKITELEDLGFFSSEDEPEEDELEEEEEEVEEWD